MTAASKRRCVIAVALSLLLHILAFSGAWLDIPRTIPAIPPLEARLVSAPPPPVVRPPEPQPKPRHTPVRRATPPVPATPVAAATTAATPFVLPPAAAPEPVAESAAPAAEQEQPAPATQPPVAQAPVAPPRSLPKKGRITYTLFLGSERFNVGTTVQSWEIDADGYKLGSVSETTGIADLFASQHFNSLSKGKITAGGLRPETFLMSRQRRGKIEASKADFEWDHGQISLGRVPVRRTDKLPAGSQDILSFMYQLALAPPAPGRLLLPVTNGAKLEIYELEVLPEENIETALGTLKSLPIKQVRRPREESIEIWLATEYRHLPVKIRFINREGEQSGEQLVNEIRISEE